MELLSESEGASAGGKSEVHIYCAQCVVQLGGVEQYAGSGIKKTEDNEGGMGG